MQALKSAISRIMSGASQPTTNSGPAEYDIRGVARRAIVSAQRESPALRAEARERACNAQTTLEAYEGMARARRARQRAAVRLLKWARQSLICHVNDHARVSANIRRAALDIVRAECEIEEYQDRYDALDEAESAESVRMLAELIGEGE